jgi:hypothetical protein
MSATHPLEENRQVSGGASRPPVIAFRSFKAALSGFKDQGALPEQFNRNIWSNKLYSTNLRELLDAFRFLGLMDDASVATPAFAALVSACDTPAWPTELQGMLERSFAPLLASQFSALAAGGLLKVVRSVYATTGEETRRCGYFFIHAAREAAMDIGPLALNSPRSRLSAERQGEDQPETTVTSAKGDPDARIVQLLLEQLPRYDATWTDDIKRHWFGAYCELVLRVRR